MNTSRAASSTFQAVVCFMLGAITLLAPWRAAAVDVNIPDVNLENALRSALGDPPGPLQDTALTTLGSLNASSRGISDLTGIEYCINLTYLDLAGNQISDVTPLSGLTGLNILYLQGNQSSELTPLSGLTSLTYLALGGNQISELTPLSGLTSLTELTLNDNQIIELTPLSGLMNLKILYMPGNQIHDVTPLSGLTTLTYLALQGNQINDVTPLSGMTSLTYLALGGNQIIELTPLSGLTSLTELSSYGNQISELTPLSGLTNLTILDLADNQISDLTPLAGLTNLNYLSLGYNLIVDLLPITGLVNLAYLSLDSNYVCELSPLVENTGLDASDSVYVYSNPLSSDSCGTDIPDLEARGVTVYSSDCSGGGLEQCPDPVDIPDLGLEAALRDQLGIQSDPLYEIYLLSLTSLDAGFRNIGDLTGLEFCTNLNNLDLSDNQISNLTPLDGLTSLSNLDLSDNQISNLTPLDGLTSLSNLDLSENQISDLTPLDGLTSLSNLYLSDNQISDVSPLEELTSLFNLYLSGNQVCDLTPLVGNSGLNYMEVQDNPLSAVSCDTAIPALEGLEVDVDFGDACNGGGVDNCDLIIVTHPQDQALLKGEALTLEVVAERGTKPYTYQWRKDSGSGPVPLGNNSATLFISDLDLSGAGNYSCRVTDAGTGNVLSDTATVTVVEPPDCDDTDSTDVPVSINETDMATSTLNIATDSTIKDVNVSLDLTHTSVGDLVITLISPVGTRVLLSYYHGGDGDDFTGTTFDDGANTSIASGTAPYAGRYRPAQFLAGVYGEQTLGDWTLEINNTAGNTGTLNSWGLSFCETTEPLGDEVDIPDPGLEAAVRDQLGIQSGPLYEIYLLSLTSLEASYREIEDLTGLEFCTNLNNLDLSGNQISDLSPLTGLTNLGNLYLSDNQISDLTPLAGLTNLNYLYLGNNLIVDLLPITGLVNLEYLNLDSNYVCELSPLVDNVGLDGSDSVDIYSNPLSSVSCGDNIPALEARGVTVNSSDCSGGGLEQCPGVIEGEGVVEGEGEGDFFEGERPSNFHSADYVVPLGRISLSELIRAIQFFNQTSGAKGTPLTGAYGCAGSGELSDEGYVPGSALRNCRPHDLDYSPQDWRITLSELLRLIQVYNFTNGAYYYCPGFGEDDDFCLGTAPVK